MLFFVISFFFCRNGVAIEFIGVLHKYKHYFTCDKNDSIFIFRNALFFEEQIKNDYELWIFSCLKLVCAVTNYPFELSFFFFYVPQKIITTQKYTNYSFNMPKKYTLTANKRLEITKLIKHTKYFQIKQHIHETKWTTEILTWKNTRTIFFSIQKYEVENEILRWVFSVQFILKSTRCVNLKCRIKYFLRFCWKFLVTFKWRVLITFIPLSRASHVTVLLLLLFIACCSQWMLHFQHRFICFFINIISFLISFSKEEVQIRQT